jgi:threonine/homoserine/homoserine lactone efflux protein
MRELQMALGIFTAFALAGVIFLVYVEFHLWREWRRTREIAIQENGFPPRTENSPNVSVFISHMDLAEDVRGFVPDGDD